MSFGLSGGEGQKRSGGNQHQEPALKIKGQMSRQSVASQRACSRDERPLKKEPPNQIVLKTGTRQPTLEPAMRNCAATTSERTIFVGFSRRRRPIMKKAGGRWFQGKQ